MLSVIGSVNVTSGSYLSAGVNLLNILSGTNTGDIAVNSLVHSNSASWNSAYTVINSQSAANTSVYTTVQRVSGQWGADYTAYTNLTANSANWQSTFNTVSSLSGNWNSAYTIGTTYQSASGSFVPNTAINNLTGNWNTAYNNSIYTINGTTNQISVTPTGNNTGNNSVTISLPNSVNVSTLNVLSTLNVAGSANFYNTTNLNVSSNIIYFGEGNTGNALDLGIITHFIGNLNNGTSKYQHTGLVRQAGQNSPGVWTLFSGLTTEPGDVNSGINWSDRYLQLDSLSANIFGNLSGSFVTVGTGNSNQWNTAYASTTALNTNFSKLSSQSYNLTQYYDINTVRGSNNITNTQGVITNNAILAGVNNCICSSENAWGSTFRNTVILNGQNNCALVTGSSNPTTSVNNLLFGSSNTICTNSGYGSSSNNAVGGQGNLTCSGGYYSSVGNTFNFGSSNTIATPFDGTTSGINNSNIFGCCNKIIGTNNGSANNSNILGGCNTICGNSNSANYSSILGGCKNVINNLSNTFILGSNITAPSANYTYVNNISSQGIVVSQGGSSNNWNTAYTTVSSNSANWNTAYASTTALNLSSANWNSVYSYVNSTSATNNPAYNSHTYSLTSTQAYCLYSNTNTGVYNILPTYGNNTTVSNLYVFIYNSTIVGGKNNTMTYSGNYTITDSGVIVGGQSNQICNTYSGGYNSVCPIMQSPTIVNGISNCVTASLATIVNGCKNTASNNFATIVNGVSGTASGCYSTVVNGSCNKATANYSTIVNGFSSCATGYATFVGAGSGIRATGDYSVVVGGIRNTNCGGDGFIGGGCVNIISSTNIDHVIVGGGQNQITTTGSSGFIGGGIQNTITSGNRATVTGGSGNSASGAYSSIGGGATNRVTNNYAVVAGGANNCSSGQGSGITGGRCNTASAIYTNINGGLGNFNPLRDSVIGGGVANHTGGYTPFNITAAASISGNGSQTCLIGTGIQNCFSYPFTSNNVSVYYSNAANPLSAGCFSTATIAATGTNYIIINGDYSSCTASSLSATSIYVYDRAINNTGYDNFIGGGKLNTASGCYGVIGGGIRNTVACGSNSTINGGNRNLINVTVNSAFADATIGGGSLNCVLVKCGTIGGGGQNTVTGDQGTVSGGYQNCLTGVFSTITGGIRNNSCNFYTFIGGSYNTASGYGSSTISGVCNRSSGRYSSVVAGVCNTASGAYSAIVGGRFNYNPLFNSDIHGGSFNHTGGYAPANITFGTNLSGNGSCTVLCSSSIGSCFSNSSTTGAVSIMWMTSGTANSSLSSACFTTANVCINPGGNCIIINGDYSTCTATGLSACSVYVYDRCLNQNGCFNFIGGGVLNTASGNYATVGGGICNIASGCKTTIGGGVGNCATGNCSTVSGGYKNTASGNYAAVGGGGGNLAVSLASVVAGGRGNAVCTPYSFIGSGYFNTTCGSGTSNAMNVIGGGRNNCTCTNSGYSVILGGCGNYNNGAYAAMVGGGLNCTSASYSVAVGGYKNTASGAYSFVAGGSANDTKSFANTFILGSSLSASAANYTYVNNISSQGAATVGGIITSNYAGASDSSVLLLGGNTKGGAGYNDFLRVYNPAAANSIWFRTNNVGSLELINSGYTQSLLGVNQTGNLLVYGGSSATSSSSNDGLSGTIQFNNNNSQIYDDGNFHIHTRGSGQSMWINTNGGDIRVGQQAPINGGSAANSVIFGGASNTSPTAYVNVLGYKTYSVTGYGYLGSGGAGTIAGNSGNVNYGLYVANRTQSAEVDVVSDERVKDIQGAIPLEDAIKFVKNIDGIKYTWKEGFGDDGLKTGFGAQSVHKAGYGHMVGHITNDKIEGKTDADGWVHPDKTQLTMGYNQAIPYHHEVIKSLLNRIEELEATVAELKK